MVLDFEVYPHFTPEERKVSYERLIDLASMTRERVKEYVARGSEVLQLKTVLLHDIDRLACWGILQVVDGYNTKYPSCARAEVASEIHALMPHMAELIVNSALLARECEGAPGYSYGYTTLLEGVVETPDSLFHDSVMKEQDLVKEIITGALWEGIAGFSSISQMIPARVATLYEAHLDVRFTEIGLEIVAGQPYSRQRGFSELEALKIMAFINDARHSGDFTPEQLKPLAKKYWEIMHSADEQGDPRLFDLRNLVNSDLFVGRSAGDFPEDLTEDLPE